MAQISITLAPALFVELSLTGVGSVGRATVVKPAPVVAATLYDVLRGPKGDPGDVGDLVSDPLAYYILAKA
ncbi:MAG: hypothetical protein RIR09_2557 [Pseudomonadota bacterium]|jgi:hypothetical protein